MRTAIIREREYAVRLIEAGEEVYIICDSRAEAKALAEDLGGSTCLRTVAYGPWLGEA